MLQSLKKKNKRTYCDRVGDTQIALLEQASLSRWLWNWDLERKIQLCRAEGAHGIKAWRREESCVTEGLKGAKGLSPKAGGRTGDVDPSRSLQEATDWLSTMGVTLIRFKLLKFKFVFSVEKILKETKSLSRKIS